MSGHYVPAPVRWEHRCRRMARRNACGMTHEAAAYLEDRLDRRLQRFIRHVHDKDFAAEMQKRFHGGVDPR